MTTTAKLCRTAAISLAMASFSFAKPSQPLEDLAVTEERIATVEVKTDRGRITCSPTWKPG